MLKVTSIFEMHFYKHEVVNLFIWGRILKGNMERWRSANQTKGDIRAPSKLFFLPASAILRRDSS